jgi:antitoxin component HigA of HigAB toxin-antitoxin module
MIHKELIALAKPIQSEEQYERALRAIRQLRQVAEGSAEEKLRKVLVNFVVAYENQEYPFGRENFAEWVAALSELTVQAKIEAIDLAELKVQLEEEFKRHRSQIIKNRLRSKKLKQNDLATILGTDKSFVSNLLNGRRELSVKLIGKIHYKLDVPYDDLMPPEMLLEET